MTNPSIAAAPPFAGLRHFPQGHRFSQWTGDDSKALMKVYLPAIEGHVPDDIVQCFHALLEFCYIIWQEIIMDDTLKQLSNALHCFHCYCQIFQETGVWFNGFALLHQHSLSHYDMLICMFGAPNGLCSSITESNTSKWWRNPGDDQVSSMHLDKCCWPTNILTSWLHHAQTLLDTECYMV